jgi:ABC-type lipoprotein release transport system permease subunit
LLESQLFATYPGDPVTYMVTSLVLLAVATLAVFVPAHRASRVDRAIVLRSE